MQYYVVQVRTGNELKTGTFIRGCLDCLPELKNVQIIIRQKEILTSRKKEYKRYTGIEKPLLPGYLILGCEQLTDELYYQIKRIHGVIRVLRYSILPDEYKLLLGQIRNKTAERLERVQERALAKEKLTLSFNNLLKKFKKYLVNNEVGGVYPVNQKEVYILERFQPLLN